jgi:hypothetical protein
MKIKLVLENDGWDNENAFEVKLPLIPQIGMTINLSEKIRRKWERMVYKSVNYNDYCPGYIYQASKENKISQEHSLSSKQCRELTILEEDAKYPSKDGKGHFSLEDVITVEAVSYDQDEDTLFILMT